MGDPFVYPLLIVLSTLRLNFRLCVFTGALAAVQYWILAAVYINRAADATIEPVLLSPPPHILKGFLFLLTGVAAGLVTIQIKKRIHRSFEMVEERNRYPHRIRAVGPFKFKLRSHQRESVRRLNCVIKSLDQLTHDLQPPKVTNFAVDQNRLFL